MHYYSLTILSIALLIGCVPVSPSTAVATQKTIYDNFDYSRNVGLSNLYPKGLSESNSPITNASGSNIILNFDLLENDYRNLTLNFTHCNRNWKPSSLRSVRFLETYNEFNPDSYYFSANTLVDYTNYKFDLPAPRISGNYVLTVKDQNSGKLILSRKMLVIDRQVTIAAEVNQNSNMNRRQNQEIDFSARYDPTLNMVPLRDFYPVILQNHIWDSQIDNLKPNLVRPDEGYVEYNHFNGENAFPAGNEYRSFDISSLEFRGMNVDLINKAQNQIQAFVSPDKTRTDLAYTQVNQDLNGQFLIQNSDLSGSKEHNEYVQVIFELKTEKFEDSNVYVFGGFNNFQKNQKNRMSYNESTESYKTSILLKQGVYDYLYVTNNENQYGSIAGNFFQVENQYEIILYYGNPLNSFDEIIGYSSILSGN